MKKRFYIVFVSRDTDGSLKKVPVPLRFAYIFVGAAVIGMFTITGLAGSYSRMLLKTARFNQMRQEQNSLRKDYANLEKVAHEKDIQAASLGSLASEVSALYGLTVNRFSGAKTRETKSAGTVATAELVGGATQANFTDENYSKSVNDFYTLRNTAMDGSATRVITQSFASGNLGHLNPFSDLSLLNAPTLWPVMGPITSAFGQREDPILGAGEGEFHKGVDISAPMGTPIRATADGVIEMAGFGNGYGREVVIDHGNGIKTVYGHMSGFASIAGQQVTRGQVIGYVGSSGRATGYHCHYEVRIRNTPVNPHKYLRETVAGLGLSTGR